MNQLWVSNRQKQRPINVRLLRRVLQAALHDLPGPGRYQLALHLIGPRTSAQLNQTFLGHEGPTDVITFPHDAGRGEISGEIFICVAEAVRQAVQFQTTWTSELVRYAVHGMLHLLGHDDKEKRARHEMKRLENRILRRLGSLFPLAELGTRRT